MARAYVPRESAIQGQILAYLQVRKDVVAMAWRNNSGALRDRTGRLVRYGKTGSADVLGVIRHSGRLLAVEVKRSGNKPTPAQAAFLADVKSAGGVAIVADDLLTVQAAMVKLAADPYASV